MTATVKQQPACAGPYCPYCQKAQVEWLANPQRFDLADHMSRHAEQVAELQRLYPKHNDLGAS